MKQGVKKAGAPSWIGCLARRAGALLRPWDILHDAVDVAPAAGPGGLTACRACDGVAHGNPSWRGVPTVAYT